MARPLVLPGVVAAVGLAAAAAVAGPGAHGDHGDTTSPAGTSSRAPVALPPPVGDLRDGVREGLAAQLEVARRTEAQVAQKRDDAHAIRRARVGAAYQVLRPTTQLGGEPERWLEAARARAAARLLLADGQHEEALLANETARLAVSAARLEGTLAEALALPRPAQRLAWPVAGSPVVARSPGIAQHEASGAGLSRRGVELEVGARANALAPAAGTVRYAGPIRGLGQGVILDHGETWSVIARLGELTVRQGDQVTARQPIGRAAAQRLYVEVRLPLGAGGVPIAPATLMTP